MTVSLSNQTQWQYVLHRQKLANAMRWLEILEKSPHPDEVALQEYDNLFKAFEFTLQDVTTFDLAYRFIRMLHTIVLGFADWDRWLSYLEQALRQSRKARQKEKELHIKELISEFLIQQGKLDEAIRYYESLRGAYQKQNNLHEYVRILIKTAVLYDRNGQLFVAKQAMQEGIEIAKQLDDARILADIYLDLSAFETDHQNWAASLEASQNAFVLYQELGDTVFANRAMVNKIACLARLSSWEEVVRLSEGLMEKMQLSGNMLVLAKLQNNLGLAAFEQKEYKKAEEYWQQALQLAEQIHTPSLISLLYCNLGLVYNSLEEWPYAEEMHQKALAMLEDSGDMLAWANTVENLAELYESQKRLDELVRLLHRAIIKLNPYDTFPHINKFILQFEAWLHKVEALSH